MADPFTGAVALGVAVNLLQIVTLSVHLAKQIWRFTDGQLALPQNLETIKQRLDIMSYTLKELDTTNFSEEAIQNLEQFLGGVDRKLKKFQKMLDEYLPESNATTMDRLKKGFQSLGKDSRVMEFADELSKDVDHLTLFLMTQSMNQPKVNTTSHLRRGIYEVVRRGVAKFVGREDQLEALAQELNNAPHIAVLQGMGGQGKTQIALEYCRRCRQAKKYSAILWANANSEQSLRESFESFSDVLKTPEETFVDSESRVRFTKRILTEWPEPWLLVLDNFDDPSKYAIRDYLPTSVKGHIIFTSRSGDARKFGNHIPVAGMTDAEALDLLMTSGGLNRTDENTIVEGAKIVNRLGNMPLAIDLAGAYLRDRAGLVSVQEFLPRYNAQADAILQVIPGVSEYSNDLRQNDTSVFATWELTVRLLEPDTEIGAQKIAFLNVIGFFDNEDISEDLFRTFYEKNRKTGDVPSWYGLFTDDRGEWSSVAFENLITKLGMISLVERPSRTETGSIQFAIHPLISDWLKIRQTRDNNILGPENYQLSARMLASCLMERYNPFLLQPAFKMPFRIQNSLTSHLLVRETFSPSLHPKTPTFFDASEPIPCVELVFIMYLYDIGFCPSSMKICERLWKTCGISTPRGRIVKRAAGAYMWHNLCTVHSHTDAEKRMREVAAFWSEALSPTHSFTLEALYYAAASLSYLGEMDEAATIYKDIVTHDSDEWKQSCKENIWFPRPEWSLVELVYVLSAQRSATKKAEVPAIVKQILEKRVKSPTVRHGSIEWNWRSYSMMIQNCQDKTVSASLSWELLSIIEKNWGKMHSNYFLAQITVMEALLDREDDASAERIMKHLLQGAENSQFSQSYRFLLWGLQNLSKLLLARNRLADAERILRQMLGVYEELPDAASAQDSVLKDLGRCLYLQGRAERADEALTPIASPSLDVLILHALVKYQIATREKLREASELLEKALTYFAVEDAPLDDDAAPGGFSLEMLLTGTDASAPGKKYKMDVNGSVSFEVLVLLGLCQVRLDDVAAATDSIADGEAAFEDGGPAAGLTAEFCKFVADRAQEILDVLNAPESTPLDDAAVEQVVALLEWAEKQVMNHAPTETDLLHRLKGLARDIQDANEAGRLAEDAQTVLSLDSGGKEKKSKIARIAKTLLSSSKKASSGNVDRLSSFASDTVTLTPSMQSGQAAQQQGGKFVLAGGEVRSPPLSPPEDLGRKKSEGGLATSPHYHVPGELPAS